MKISHISDTVTTIELTRCEVTKYQLSFEQSDYTSAHSRRALWSLIDDAEKLCGKVLQIDSTLEIDFMPDIKGGCLVIISRLSNENVYPQIKLYQTTDTDALIDFSAVALTLSPDTVCDLYEKDGTYRLIATVSDSKTDILASEYGFEITQNSIAIESTKEGYHCLISDRALEVLGGLFSEK